MGVKLFSGMQNGERYEKDSFQRLSSPTQDGVLQLTPDGLIALLRSRGTIGGYPQVGQILDADVDKLAQLKPGSGVKFRLIELEEAERIQSIYEEFLKQIVKA